ncbi:MAG: hypothetical protein P0Y62_01625 [Candidatus Chryseobacterium colombiense]|nr:hypothetical protein [Chryseobacterium sp.]WEK70255.1 MAG: hypothetical protein P0Y62_01625 [Chryseobacterium sp.]
MGKYNIKKLPKGFRFLLSLKEIKEIENHADLKFTNVTYGSLANSKIFNDESFFQSSFRGFSIQGLKKGSIWEFSLLQKGFRDELLPEIYEIDIKKMIKEKVKDYLSKVYYSKETDCYNNPQLWCLISIIQNKADVSWTESK